MFSLGSKHMNVAIIAEKNIINSLGLYIFTAMLATFKDNMKYKKNKPTLFNLRFAEYDCNSHCSKIFDR